MQLPDEPEPEPEQAGAAQRDVAAALAAEDEAWRAAQKEETAKALALLDEGEPVHREAFRAFREATLQACPPLPRPCRCASAAAAALCRAAA